MEIKINKVIAAISKLLKHKNLKYGNAALAPLKIFSRLDTANSLKIRMDDKLSRIANSDELRKNDIVDLLGYLILYCVDQDWVDFTEFED